VALLPGVELNWKWAMVPLTNISLAMKELVKGPWTTACYP
jgi:sodium transport system permease protein